MKYNAACVQPNCFLITEDYGEQEVTLEELQVHHVQQHSLLSVRKQISCLVPLYLLFMKLDKAAMSLHDGYLACCRIILRVKMHGLNESNSSGPKRLLSRLSTSSVQT